MRTVKYKLTPMLSLIHRSFMISLAIGVSVTVMWTTDTALAQTTEQAKVANQGGLEEVIVTARKREESLQDVPITIQTISGDTVEVLNLQTIRDFADLVPTFITTQRAAGSGATLSLRGIGTGHSEAFFDSSVAMNFDDIVANNSRMMNNANLDTAQIDVLKGPQSLYFGKGTTAGVIAIRSNNPTEELEVRVRGGYEFDENGNLFEAILSGPLTDNFMARFAINRTEAKEVQKNNVLDYNPDADVSKKYRGEKSLTGRLTLLWTPTDNLKLNFKYGFSNYENDAQYLFSDVRCANGVSRQDTLYTLFPFGFPSVPGAGDCDWSDDVIQLTEQHPILAASFKGNNGGVPFTEVDLSLSRLAVDWDINDDWALTAVTAYLKMDSSWFDLFNLGATHGINGVAGFDNEKSVSQEVRVFGQVTDSVSLQFGAFYQDRDLRTENLQDSFGAVLASAELGIFPGGADPITGSTADYDRFNTLSAKTKSVFGSINWAINDRWVLDIGARWTDEKKESFYHSPFVHTAYPLIVGPAGIPSTPSGFISAPIPFKDDNISPEASLNWAVNDQTNLYAAYKEGFKSGGIGSSILPIGFAAIALETQNWEPFVYQSETVKGFEVGSKSDLMNGRLRLNTTIYRYIYKDLQLQQFLSLQFTTFNAGELTNQGIDIDAHWAISDVYSLRGVVSYLDNEYTKSFTNAAGTELEGLTPVRSPKFSGNVALTGDYLFGDGWTMGFSATAYYMSSYMTDEQTRLSINELEQKSSWRGDLSAYWGTSDGHWRVSLVAKNITNKLIWTDSQAVAPTKAAPDGSEDKNVFLNRGRRIWLKLEYRF